MSREERKKAAFQRELAKVEVIASLRHAVDLRYRRLLELARADWERLFESDPSDACVTVRVTPEQPRTQVRAVPGSGFLKSTRSSSSKPAAKGALPGFAH